MKKSKKKNRPRAEKAAAETRPHVVRPKAAAVEAGLPPLGLEAEVEQVIPFSWTIQAINSSLPPVLSTPAMIGMMEFATANALRPSLPPGTISVGTRIEVDHLKAVADGATLRAKGRLVAYQGRFLVFDVEAWSGAHMVGRGRVFRALVKSDLHGDKAKARVEDAPVTSFR
jgi:fluoroacetyl-CoA thioesterase